MDTVILAAGRGSRLGDLAPPFFKPLLIVDGEPLVRRIARTALDLSDGRVIVVAAPENTLPLCQVLEGIPLDVVVQRQASGPGHALLTGLRLVTSTDVCVLLGDNVMSSADHREVACAPAPAVGVVELGAEAAVRYTYLAPDGTWVEKQPVAGVPTVPCWVGPLKLESGAIRRALENHIRDRRTSDGEVPLGPLLNSQGRTTLVPVSSVDVGTPGAWRTLAGGVS